MIKGEGYKEQNMYMRRKRVSLLVLIFLVTFIFYGVVYSLNYSLGNQVWLLWFFVFVNLLLVARLNKLANGNLVWNKKIIFILLSLAILFVSTLVLPSKRCDTFTKYDQINSCDCLGVKKNTSLFSTGCIGVRTRCYQNKQRTMETPCIQ